MKYQLIKLMMYLTISSTTLSAQTALPITHLGQLQQVYTPVADVQAVPMRSINAAVTFKTGEAFQLIAPFEAQKHDFMVNDGEMVEAGAPIMVLSGSEVHHFMEQYEAAKDLYELANNRYQKNKALYAQKSISNERWIEIADFYFKSKIEFGHYRHFYEWVHSVNSEDEVVLKAPISGYFLYPRESSLQAGELKLGQLLPADSLHLSVYASQELAAQIQWLKTENCQLGIDQVSQNSEGYFLQLWSEPVIKSCELKLGQQISVTPVQQIDAYQVPKSSVFSIDRNSYVMIKQAEKLQQIRIEIVGAEHASYYIQSNSKLSGKSVLSSSVAAIQGILMGLGGE
jgi:hypothetical protein